MRRTFELISRWAAPENSELAIQQGCSKRSSNEAAGRPATEAYDFRYVAGRRATENKVGGRFQQPSQDEHRREPQEHSHTDDIGGGCQEDAGGRGGIGAELLQRQGD